MYKIVVFLAMVLFFLGCNPRDLEDFQASGQELVGHIAAELATITSDKDLSLKKRVLKKDFRKLAKLMVQAAEYHRKHEDEEFDSLRLHPNSDRLCYEFLRIASEVEGGKLFLEELQQEILDCLDVDIRKHQKSKNKIK